MRTWHTIEGPVALRIRPGGEKFTVWTQYCCIAVFNTFAEAAAYIRGCCCLPEKLC